MIVMRLLSSLKHDESERGIFQLGRMLVKNGHTSIIIASANPDQSLVKRLERDGNHYHKLVMRKKSWSSLFKVLALRRMIEHYSPDIIHVHSRTPAWVLYWALKGARVTQKPKLVSTIYGFYPLNSYSHALLRSDTIISVSDSVTDYLKAELGIDDSTEQANPLSINVTQSTTNPSKSDITTSITPVQQDSCQKTTDNKSLAKVSVQKVSETSSIDVAATIGAPTPTPTPSKHKSTPKIVRIYRGVDTRKYLYRYNPSVYWLRKTFAEFPELEHKKWLLFPTVIGQEYGQEWLIDILGNLQGKYPNIHVIIMDDDKDRAKIIYEEFRQRAFALGLDDKITFVGKKRNDLREWLAAANIVLALANRPESIGITILQAIHLGTPVVGWDKAAYHEILSHLFPQGLVKHYNAVTLCKSIKAQLEMSNRPIITEAFTLKQMVDETMQVYQDLYDG